MKREAVPVTAAGGVVVALGLASYLSGWRLGWIELMVVAAGCLLAIAAAAPFVIGRLRLDVVRTLDPPRAMVGDRAVAMLEVRNPRGSATRARTIEESIARHALVIELPALGRGEAYRTVYPLPTASRGAITVGPAVIARQDPLQLMRREVRHAGEATFWIHPRHVALPALPVGFAKDLEGPTSDTSPAGDVAFHALREYQLGDDYRHIHWMSTARANAPMVRHHVDNRRPHVLVVVDDIESSTGPAEFEVALEVAASIAVSSMLHREPVAVWTSRGPILGRSRPGSRDDLLDRLAELRLQREGDLSSAALSAQRAEHGTSALVVVTGSPDASSLAVLASQARRRSKVVIVRSWPPGERMPQAIPGAQVVDVESLADFERAWRRVAR